MNLRAGVLIIGSLYWDKERADWRKERLDIDNGCHVSVPIRYGRRSSTRSYTFTMVFEREPQNSGQAIVIEFKNSFSSSRALLAEAAHLWKAEYKKADKDSISTSWGCVALLLNPIKKIPEDVLKEWAEKVKKEKNYEALSSHGGATVDKYGMLLIQWPRLLDERPLELDLLLATTNSPDLEGDPLKYPSPCTIARAWRRAEEQNPQKHEINYFWQNRKSGIITFEDDEIERILAGMNLRAAS